MYSNIDDPSAKTVNFTIFPEHKAAVDPLQSLVDRLVGSQYIGIRTQAHAERVGDFTWKLVDGHRCLDHVGFSLVPSRSLQGIGSSQGDS